MALSHFLHANRALVLERARALQKDGIRIGSPRALLASGGGLLGNSRRTRSLGLQESRSLEESGRTV